jgi:uncharacterized protein YndB with AHSA1/START domain
MPVTTVETELEDHTLTVIADFDAPVEDVWELWANPGKLGLWWGPPGYATTFEPYELSAGSQMAHCMTGPDGDRHEGVWRIESVDPPRSLELSDADVGESGEPNDGLALTGMAIELAVHDRGTRMTVRSTFFSREGMKGMAEGFAEGLRLSLNRMEALLADSALVTEIPNR